MKRRVLCVSCLLGLGVAFFYGRGPAWAAEKVRVGMSVKVSAHYYLPGYAAEEKGLWRENGLEVSLVPFQGGGLSYRAMAGGAIDLNMSSSAAFFQGAAGGVPVNIVSDLYWLPEFILWVRTESRFKEPKDLKGAKIGVAAFGGIQHAYARAIVAGLGLEKETRFVATGGVPENLAALRTGVIDAVVLTPYQLIMMKLKGEVRELVTVADHLPRDWSEHIVSARREFISKNPEGVKRAVRAIVQATEFIRKDPEWAMDQMRKVHGYSDEAVRLMYEQYVRRGFTEDGKIRRKGLENVRNFLAEYGIVPREKLPALERVIREEFLPL